jgi:DNA mismatch repair protein MutL
VKSKLLAAALERAYENQRMVGKFPGCVLQIQVKPSEVDVNVHPAKTEVKFLYERRVFDGVYYTLLAALTQQAQHPQMTFSPRRETAQPAPENNSKPIISPPTPSLADQLRGEPIRDIRDIRPTLPLRDSGRRDASVLLRPEGKENSQPTRLVPAAFPQEKAEISPKHPEKSTLFSKPVDNSVENVEKPMEESRFSGPGPLFAPPPLPTGLTEEPDLPPPQPQADTPPWRLVGEVLRTYVIVEQGERVLLIDKHAAHERMHFDRMKAAGWQPMAQTLLAPVLFTPAPQEGEVLLAHLPLLSRFGFACEDFGGGTLAVREIPDDLEPGQAEETLCEIAQTLLTGDKADPAAARDAVLHTMACKAAVKGGQKNSREELMVVAEAVVSGRVKYCPHGRPVAITMTRTELEKQFKRI